ncbi:MAG: hypothetical protein NTW04_00530 [Elusimicrobia bacterium]|nr:hypothetical protein [Elusimicrobiota bacterium]
MRHKGIILFLALFMPAQLFAAGYVAEVSGKTVYIDISLSREKISEGQKFEIISEGKAIISPVTKKKIGRAVSVLAYGKITMADAKLAVGEIQYKKSGAAISVKQKVRFVHAAVVKQKASAKRADKPSLNLLWQSPAMEGAVLSFAIGDINGDKINEIVISFGNKMAVYTAEGATVKKLAEVSPPLSQKIISVDCADLKGLGKAQIYAAVIDSFMGNIVTHVYQYSAFTLYKSQSIRQIARMANSPVGKKVYAQEIYGNAEMAKLPVKELVYKNERFATQDLKGETLPSWLYGFAFAGEGLAYITDSNAIKFSSSLKSFETGADFGKTANQIVWKREELNFYPRLPVHKFADGRIAVYGVANVGVSVKNKGGKIRKLDVLSGELAVGAEADMGGYVSDISDGKLGALPEGVIAAVNADNGKFYIKLLAY